MHDLCKRDLRNGGFHSQLAEAYRFFTEGFYTIVSTGSQSTAASLKHVAPPERTQVATCYYRTSSTWHAASCRSDGNR
jgi:hypothetical protein